MEEKRSTDLLEFRRNLPIFKSKRQIIEIISKNNVTILIGETGCGKSTQLPQYLIESQELKGCSVCITQPRRVSAISLAKRVALEKKTKLGSFVGYNVRFDNCTSEKTKIRYVTDGMLLREILSDPDLSAYDVVILDEIHERTVQTDLLIGLLRDLQRRRNIKLVLMSATLHCQLFVDFFDNPPIIHVRGRTFPVSIFYTDQPEQDYIEATSLTILQLNQDLDMPGDFLVFMTGQEEIEEVIAFLSTHVTNPPMKILPLYAALPMDQQQRVFDKAPEGHRKVILSTNIAETSVTISGIKYVIDSGLVKIKSFNPLTGIEVLGTTPISKAQALQRSGRAGRESEGACFRLYTEDDFFKLKDSPVAEIRRADLSSVVIQLFALGIKNPMTFSFLERPPTDLIKESLNTVYALNAIDNNGELTEDGKMMARFPLTPRLTKILLLASKSGCGKSALTLLAMMSCENLFVVPSDKRKKAREKHCAFNDGTGDHTSLIHIFNAYTSLDKKTDPKKYCYDNFLSKRALDYAVSVRQQLESTSRDLGINVEEDEEDENRLSRLRQCLVIASPENVAIQITQGKYKCIDDQTEISIHPSSFSHLSNMKCIVFSERVQTKKLYARWVSMSEPSWVDLEVPK